VGRKLGGTVGEAALTREWHNPLEVVIAVASLEGHPLRLPLGRLLASMVRRDPPQHLGLLPADFVRRVTEQTAVS